MSWKSKRYSMVARSGAEVEYRAMIAVTSKLVWNKQMLIELKFGEISSMKLVCEMTKRSFVSHEIWYFMRGLVH